MESQKFSELLEVLEELEKEEKSLFGTKQECSLRSGIAVFFALSLIGFVISVIM